MPPRSKPSSASNASRRQKKEDLRKKTQAAASDKVQQTTLPFLPVPGPQSQKPAEDDVGGGTGHEMMIDSPPPSAKQENPPLMIQAPSHHNTPKQEGSHDSPSQMAPPQSNDATEQKPQVECPASRRDFAFLMKLVASSRSFDELQEKFDIHLRFNKEPQQPAQLESGIQLGNRTKRGRYSLHRLLAIVRAGKQMQREEAYKVLALQWVRLAQHKGFFPVLEENAASDVLEDYIEVSVGGWVLVFVFLSSVSFVSSASHALLFLCARSSPIHC